MWWRKKWVWWTEKLTCPQGSHLGAMTFLRKKTGSCCLMDDHPSPPISSSPWSLAPLGWPGRGPSLSTPRGVLDLAGQVEEEKESPGEDGPMLAVRARGCSLAGASGGSAWSHLLDQPALSFLCVRDRDLQRIKAGNTQRHCFVRKCLEMICT